MIHAKVTNVCTLCILEIYSCFDCAGVNGVGQVLDWSNLRHNIKFLYQTRLSICINIIVTYFDEKNIVISNIKNENKKNIQVHSPPPNPPKPLKISKTFQIHVWNIHVHVGWYINLINCLSVCKITINIHTVAVCINFLPL